MSLRGRLSPPGWPPATGGRGGSPPPTRPAQGKRATQTPAPRPPAEGGCHVIALVGPVPIPGTRSPAGPAVRAAAAHWRYAAGPIRGRPSPSHRTGGT